VAESTNDDVVIANNRIVANAGTNLAGAVGIFSRANRYEIARNDICGNFSAEYGGGISVYGPQCPLPGTANDGCAPAGGKIHHNRIWFNRSYDEGGGIMIAGALPADPMTLSRGSGPVDIFNNVIQANLANDDGGGIRFLMAGNYPMNVYNNFIVNNVSTHEGAGVALDDAPDVRLLNNTVMKNITTATAATSNGLPAPAGLSTGRNSDGLQATLPAGSPTFSNPLLFNNVFWDNRAGTRAGATVIGIGASGDGTPVNHWDMGAADGSGLLSPTSSVLQDGTGIVPDASNVQADPSVVLPYDTSVTLAPWRTNPNFVGAILVAVEAPPNRMGDYHLAAGSPAIDRGAATKGATSAPTSDIDDHLRPYSTTSPAQYDAGAHEFGSTTIAGGGGGGGGGTGGGSTVPALAVLDDFNRANAGTLGASWSQLAFLGNAALRVDANQGYALLSGSATWNAPSTGFGASQGAAFTFAGTSLDGAALVLKATQGTATLPARYIRVQYQTASGGRIVVATTTTAGLAYTNRGTIAASFAPGDVLTAVASPTGLVTVFKTSGVASTIVGTVQLPTTGANAWTTQGGRIGIQLPTGGRIDNFSGGSVP
jgi:hypothetical protein